MRIVIIIAICIGLAGCGGSIYDAPPATIGKDRDDLKQSPCVSYKYSTDKRERVFTHAKCTLIFEDNGDSKVWHL